MWRKKMVGSDNHFNYVIIRERHILMETIRKFKSKISDTNKYLIKINIVKITARWFAPSSILIIEDYVKNIKDT